MTFRKARSTIHTVAAWRSARQAMNSSDILRDYGARWVFEARHGPNAWGPRQPVEPIPYQITHRASRARQEAAWQATIAAMPAPEPDLPGRLLFSNGSQWADWQGANCERCAKGALNEDGWAVACPLLNLLFDAECGDGTVSEETAQRCGYIDHEGAYVWPCNEVEWSEEWKAEYRRRKGE